MEIILYQPQIPQNTGNIVRTCAVTGTDLTLVEPLGYSIQDRWLKRAGLDYWDQVQVQTIPSLEEYLASTRHPFYFFSSHAKKCYSTPSFSLESLLIFGSEDLGLPDNLWEQWPDRFYSIPMVGTSRCLNLSTSTGVVLYEALRQNNFSFC